MSDRRRTLSLFWTGPMSWMRYMTFLSFHHYNPLWEIELWTSDRTNLPKWNTKETVDLCGYEGEDWWPAVEKIVTVRQYDSEEAPPNILGDLCRWDTCAKGGIFADADILFLQPMSDFYMEVFSKNAISCQNGFVYLGMVSGKGRPFSDIAKVAHSSVFGEYQSAGALALYQVAFGGSTVADAGPREIGTYATGADTLGMLSEKTRSEIVNIPAHWVHPFSPYEVTHPRNFEIPADTLGVHWYGGDPYTQQWSFYSTPELAGHVLALKAQEIFEEYLDGR